MMPWIALLVACAPAVQSHDANSAGIGVTPTPAERERLLLEERPRARERNRQIEGELRSSDLPPWAGKYTTGGSYGGYTVAVAPKSGLTFKYEYDVGGSDRWNHGPIVSASDRCIQVDFVLPVETLVVFAHGKEIPAVSRTIVLVPWGDRDYLVPEHRLIELCNRANDRSEWWFPHAAHYMFPCRTPNGRARIDDPESVPPPEVPPEFRKYLLSSEVLASVVSAEAPRIGEGENAAQRIRWKFAVTADVERNRELVAGMQLYLTDSREGFEPGEIVEVSDTTCRVMFERTIDSNPSTTPVVPTTIPIGARLSSVRPLPSYVRQLRALQQPK
jgi:hypothetical protein